MVYPDNKVHHSLRHTDSNRSHVRYGDYLHADSVHHETGLICPTTFAILLSLAEHLENMGHCSSVPLSRS